MIEDIFDEELLLPIWAAIIAVFLAIVWYLWQKNRDLPPGPKGLPLVGYWPFLKDDDQMHLQLEEMVRKYGDVCSFRVTGTLYVLLSSSKAIREAHLTRSECFKERCLSYNTLRHLYDQGVAFCRYQEWKVLRKFFLLHLRDYGLNALKENTTDFLRDILMDNVRQLKNKNGEPVELVSVVKKGCIESMKNLIFAEGKVTDDEIKELLEEYDQILVAVTTIRTLPTGLLAKHLILPSLFDYKKFVASHKKIEDILYKVVARHEASLDEGHPSNIIDLFLLQRKKLCEKGDPTATYFTDKALVHSLVLFGGDGAVSVIHFIELFLQELVRHPDVQDKMYKEIVETVGEDRQPTIEDKSRLPYTTAVLNEIIRLSHFFPAFPSQECTTETTIGGYRIPKGSITLMNSWSINRDPAKYKDPSTFNPMRFLAHPDRPKEELPSLFGVGKRSCIGEAFTMNQVFLNVTTLVKNFRLTAPEEGKVETVVLGRPMPYLVCFHSRS